jgi:hypothetical protein
MKDFPCFGVKDSLLKLILYTSCLDADFNVYFGVRSANSGRNSIVRDVLTTHKLCTLIGTLG